MANHTIACGGDVSFTAGETNVVLTVTGTHAHNGPITGIPTWIQVTGREGGNVRFEGTAPAPASGAGTITIRSLTAGVEPCVVSWSITGGGGDTGGGDTGGGTTPSPAGRARPGSTSSPTPLPYDSLQMFPLASHDGPFATLNDPKLIIASPEYLEDVSLPDHAALTPAPPDGQEVRLPLGKSLPVPRHVDAPWMI